MKSIRRHLTLILLAGGFVLLALSGVVMYTTMSRALVQSFDETSLYKARHLGTLLEFTGTRIDLDDVAVAIPEFKAGPDPEYFELYSDNADHGYRSASLGQTDLPCRGGPPDSPQVWNLELPDGRKGRALGVQLVVQASDDDEDLAVPREKLPELPGVTVVVARSREDLDKLLGKLTFGVVASGAAALALMIWGVQLGVGRGLRPLEKLGEEVAEVDASSLSKRVGSKSLPRELAPLADKVNELLGRIEMAFARQRRMTAAMAHELRTPIAELRTSADVARRWPEDEPLAREVVNTAGDVALRMSDAVEAVMRYCRMEVGQAEPELERLPLRDFVQGQWAAFESLACERGIEFENLIPAQLEAFSDLGLLGIVLGNLLNNAASFAESGCVRATAAVDGKVLSLKVSNLTQQLSSTDLQHLSEPFWRKDEARTSRRHNGLGLTLVQSVTSVLGHHASFALEGGEFVVTIELPTSGPTSKSAGSDESRELSHNAPTASPQVDPGAQGAA